MAGRLRGRPELGEVVAIGVVAFLARDLAPRLEDRLKDRPWKLSPTPRVREPGVPPSPAVRKRFAALYMDKLRPLLLHQLGLAQDLDWARLEAMAGPGGTE